MTTEQYYWYIRRPQLLRQQAMMRAAGNTVQTSQVQQDNTTPLTEGKWTIEWSDDAKETFDQYALGVTELPNFYQNDSNRATWSEDYGYMEVSYQKYSEDDDYCKWTLSVASNSMQFILEQLSYIEGAWNEVEEHTYDKTLQMRAAENSLYFNKGDLIATLRWSAT